MVDLKPTELELSYECAPLSRTFTGLRLAELAFFSASDSKTKARAALRLAELFVRTHSDDTALELVRLAFENHQEVSNDVEAIVGPFLAEVEEICTPDSAERWHDRLRALAEQNSLAGVDSLLQASRERIYSLWHDGRTSLRGCSSRPPGTPRRLADVDHPAVFRRRTFSLLFGDRSMGSNSHFSQALANAVSNGLTASVPVI